MLKATENNAVYTSQILKQEAGDGDWASYDLTVTTDPKDLGVLDSSTQTQLNTSVEVVSGDELIIHDGTSFKEGTIGTVTYDADLVPPQSINNTTYDSISASLKSSVTVNSSVTYDNVNFNAASQDTNPFSIAFNNDGTKMYMLGTSSDRVYQYSLATAFDLSTCSYDNVNFNVGSQDTIPLGITFNNDGTKMYMVGTSSDRVYQYSLATAFDLSTCSYDNVNFSVASQDTNPYSITFNNDGTKMYMVGYGSDRVYQYSLATAFDLSTCSYDNVSFSVVAQDTFPVGITFNNDGTKMYMVGQNGDRVYQYSLATAFDLSTCSYDNVSFSVASQDTNPASIAFNNDGTKMYMLGDVYDSVYQYSLSVPYLIGDSTVSVPATDFKTIKLV